MFSSIVRFDILLVILFFLFMVEKIFLSKMVITPVYILIFLILVSMVFLVENKIKINIFLLFFSYIFIRTLFNVLSPDENLLKLGLSATIQIISIAFIIPAIYYTAQNHEKRIRLIISTIKIFIFLNTLILILSVFNIYIVSHNLYESYGNRYFGIIGDQLAWIITFMIAYCMQYKKYYLLIFYLLGLLFTGSLNAAAVGIIILFYYIFKKISLTNIIYIVVFILILILLLNFLHFNILERLSSGQYDESLKLRLLSIGFAVTNIHNYLFGNGYGIYSYLYKPYMVEGSTTASVIFSNAFNQYLQILIDSGIIGLVLFFIMLYRIFRLQTFEYSYIKVWIITYLIFNQSAVWLLPSSYLWILIAIGLGILIHEDNKIRKMHRKLNCSSKKY